MSVDTEETPLISVAEDHKHEAIYARFDTHTKRVIVALVSWSALIPMFASASFTPAIPRIAADLHTTGSVVSLAISLSIFGAAIGSMLFATYSGYYGRRPVYLCGLPLLGIGSIGVSLATNVPQLMVWRFIQAFGTSGGMSVGAGVIGDIYRLEERGTAMGIFFGASLLGPALAPLAGGWVAHYSSWRNMQSALAVAGFMTFALMAIWLPETTQPGTRGVDKAMQLRSSDGETRRWKWVWLNPLASLGLLRSPNLMLVTLAGTAVLCTDLVLLIPLAYTIGVRYNITNEALIGACFLPCGLGNIIGAPLSGFYSDRVVIQWRKRRGGVWVPEDRLRAAMFGAITLVPCSVLFAGLTTHFVDGTPGLVMNLFFLLLNGIGVDLVLSPCAAYGVDIMHARSAEMMAANNGFRALLLSAIVAGILPSINHFGVLFTNTVAAIFAWLGFGMLWVTIRYGDKMRAWIDVGYSTAENN